MRNEERERSKHGPEIKHVPLSCWPLHPMGSASANAACQPAAGPAGVGDAGPRQPLQLRVTQRWDSTLPSWLCAPLALSERVC